MKYNNNNKWKLFKNNRSSKNNNINMYYYFTIMLLLMPITLSSAHGDELPFSLPFDDTGYNEQKLVVTNGLDGSAATAMWKVDVAKGKLTVAMATTQAFVALGFNPSTPAMSGSDIVACHREACNKVVARDYFAVGYGTPAEDMVNDWEMKSSGITSSGTTWCIIERAFLTCNTEEDFQIFDVDASVSGLLAFGTDPNRPELHYHGMNRKFTQFVFNEEALAAKHALLSKEDEQLSEHVITSPISIVPHDNTGAEICSYHILPPEMANGDRKHVVNVLFDQPIAEARDAGLTHHTILYGCPKLVSGYTDGQEVDCSFTWEHCGSDWLEPGKIIRSNEGVPVGKNIVVATVLLRHFYNPQLLVGMKDQNRWRIFYTQNLRPMEPVVINLQTTHLEIPALSKSVTRVYMPEECTERVGEITIEAIRHHMHDYGIAGRLRHIRGNQELAPVHEMPGYRRGVSEGWIGVNRRLEPGDMLIYECYYDNTLNKTVVWGERREDEMCVVALKTKGTNITNALSYLPSSGTRNPDVNSYSFVCSAPAYKNLKLPSFRIAKTTFDERISNILPYEKVKCNSIGPTAGQRSRALPNKCPTGWRQPTSAEECKAANPTRSATMQNCDSWPDGAPKCFLRTDSETFCWKSNGAESSAWGMTLMLCIPEEGIEQNIPYVDLKRCESDPKNECFKETCCGQGTRFVNGKCAATYEGLIEACKKDRGRFGFTCEADQSLSCAT